MFYHNFNWLIDVWMETEKKGWSVPTMRTADIALNKKYSIYCF